MMIKCAICAEEVDGLEGLRFHLDRIHGMYYGDIKEMGRRLRAIGFAASDFVVQTPSPDPPKSSLDILPE